MATSESNFLEPVDYSNLDNEEQPMTYILGAKCSDGVVMVSDTLVANLRTGVVNRQEKLFGRYYPIVLGASGLTGLAQEFMNKSFLAAQEKGKPTKNSGEILMYPPRSNERLIREDYLNDLQKIVNELDGKEISALIALQMVKDNISSLHLIEKNGKPTQVNCYAIGIGRYYGEVFLKKCWNEEWTMKETAKLAAFIIKYIHDFELNNAVGGKPQIWLIPNKGEVKQIELESSDNTVIENKLKEHELHLVNLFK